MKRFLSKLWRAIIRNPKTSIAGVLGFAATTLAHFNLVFPQGLQEEIAAFAVLLVGLLSEDSKAAE